MATVSGETASVHIDTQTFAMTRNITGVVSLRIGDDHFPEQRWNDFPVIVLGWWLTRLARLWRGEPDAAAGVECLFMDGDYYFAVSPTGSRWSIECVDGTRDGEIVATAEVERESFMRDLLTCAARALAACQARGWRASDTDELAATVARIETELLPRAA